MTSAALAQIPQNWFPQDIEALGQNASSRTEFSLDRSMLVLASKEDPNDESLRRVIAGVNGISVHRFRFQGPGMYDPRVLGAVRHDYSMAGWQHISKAHDKYGYPRDTDLWIHIDHNVIRNIAVLFTNADQVNFISVSGSISPIDLLHLGGHFGIPRIEGGVAVPGPGPDRGPYPPAPAPDDRSVPPPSAGPNDPPPVSGNSPQSDDDYRRPAPDQQNASPQQ
jgi:hypothetical protein